MMNKVYNYKQITSFDECSTNIQRLLVDFFSNLVLPEYFEKKENEEKRNFEYFDNLLKKDPVFAKIGVFISSERT